MFHPFTSLGFVLGSILFFEVPFVHGHPPAQAPIGGTGQSSLAHSGPLDETGPLAPISRARPLQEVFQIHAPVLTTAGPLTVDEDASDDGWVDVSSDGDAAMNGAHGGNGHESGTDEGQGACTVVLMEHSFGQSYGRPFVGPYLPPLCEFNQVILNLTVTSRGRQFDRLASLYLGDVEIFRTSTAEPTADGIRWTYTKDVSSYLSLFKISQKIIFDLGNLINEKYTAPFNVTLTALFFSDNVPNEAATLILPISARRSEQDQPSAFFLPDDRAHNRIKLPGNTKRAVVSLLATGQAIEEFWFGNVLSTDVGVDPGIPDPLPGYSPFREVQLWINGSLAGVVSPYPTIFTGGFCPALWRPIVGIDAFDLRPGEIDISPWLPLLCDPAEDGYDFEIRVVGLDEDGKGNATISDTVGSYWVVTGTIFAWVEERYYWTSGYRLSYSAPEPTIKLRDYKFSNVLMYSATVHRHFSISSMVWTYDGLRMFTWTQDIRCQISGELKTGLDSQIVRLWADGYDSSSGGYAARYTYTAHVEVDLLPDKDHEGTYMEGLVDRGLSLKIQGPSVHAAAMLPHALSKGSVRKNSTPFSSMELNTRQGGDFTMQISHRNISWASAATDQGLRYFAVDAAPGLEDSAESKSSESSPSTSSSSSSSSAHSKTELYRRRVLAHNGVLLKDDESLQEHISDDDWEVIPSKKKANRTTDPKREMVAFETDQVLGRFPLTLQGVHRLVERARDGAAKERSEKERGWMGRCWEWLRRGRSVEL